MAVFFPLIGNLYLLLGMVCLSMPISAFGCIKSEKQALLGLKSGLRDPSNYLSSWDEKDDKCCQWTGVECSNKTGHVISLDLFGLEGEINSSLLGLRHLHRLDLSVDNFDAKPIPKFLGSFRELRYLSLYECGYVGVVPHELGNLTTLIELGISDTQLVIDDAKWLANLNSLRSLQLDRVNLSKARGLSEALKALPFIREIYLQGCSLTEIPLSVPHANFTYLTNLSLSDNPINSPIGVLKKIGNLCSLRTLWFDSVNLSMGINVLGDVISGCLLTNLEDLSLGNNSLSGSLPNWLWTLKKLRSLDLRENSLHGPVPNNIGSLTNLEDLSLGSNFFTGFLTEAHLLNLSRLKSLDLSYNPYLTLNIKHDWHPPFQLVELFLSYLKVGPSFPLWLCTQKTIRIVMLRNASISHTIPKCFWSSSNASYINLSDNMLVGTIPERIGNMLPNLRDLFLSRNHIHGEIPSSMCSFKNLTILDLSSNSLSGSMPDCWSPVSPLWLLNFSNNVLLGTIPNSIFSENLNFLHLQNNNLSGELSFLESYCKNLVVLDIAQNNLVGTMPASFGDNMPSLMILMLQSNNISGPIPPQISNLRSLRILDLSLNNISGAIPASFGKFVAMKHVLNDTMVDILGGEIMLLDITGRERTYYAELLSEVVSMDLSDNNLSGKIPEELGNLSWMISLDLSNNNLTGGIIQTINRLRQLQHLDLSKNKLSGPIPSALSVLNFLSFLNLSYNNFSGPIPIGNQLQTLDDPSIYIGNDDLCGFPLDPCQPSRLVNVTSIDNSDQDNTLWFYLGVAHGFAVGFWFVCGSILIRKSWRTAYFQFIDGTYNAILVFVAVAIKTVCNKKAS